MLWGVGEDRGVVTDGLSNLFNLDPGFNTHTQIHTRKHGLRTYNPISHQSTLTPYPEWEG